jgi:broad specificity phosphatase PhoE
MHHARSRTLAALHHWRSLHFAKALIVVSLSDIIKALLAPALGLPLDRLHRLTIDPASVSTLVMYDDDVPVDGVNRA